MSYESQIPNIDRLRGEAKIMEIWIDCVHETLSSMPKKERTRFDVYFHKLFMAKLDKHNLSTLTRISDESTRQLLTALAEAKEAENDK